jgi:hypothetical protein
MEILSAAPVTLAAILAVFLAIVLVIKLRRASKTLARILSEEFIAEKEKTIVSPRTGPAHRRAPAHRGARTSPLRTLQLPAQPTGNVHRHAS